MQLHNQKKSFVSDLQASHYSFIQLTLIISFEFPRPLTIPGSVRKNHIISVSFSVTQEIVPALATNVGREEIEEMEEMEEDSTEIGRQRNEERRMEQANCAPGRHPGRPVEEAGRPTDAAGVSF